MSPYKLNLTDKANHHHQGGLSYPLLTRRLNTTMPYPQGSMTERSPEEDDRRRRDSHPQSPTSAKRVIDSVLTVPYPQGPMTESSPEEDDRRRRDFHPQPPTHSHPVNGTLIDCGLRGTERSAEWWRCAEISISGWSLTSELGVVERPKSFPLIVFPCWGRYFHPQSPTHSHLVNGTHSPSKKGFPPAINYTQPSGQRHTSPVAISTI